MDDLLKDVRFGLRSLVSQPAFTGVAVLSLALGIGLNTTIFSVVKAIALDSVHVDTPASLVEIYSSASEEFPHLTNSYPDYVDLRDGLESVVGLAAHAIVRAIVIRPSGDSELLAGETVTHNYFDLLGVNLATGRSFTPEEDQVQQTHAVVILSHNLWQSQFAGDSDVIGRSLTLSGRDYAVVGVAPPEFTGTIPGLRPEFWVPTAMIESVTFSGIQASTGSRGELSRREYRGARWLFVKGRMRDGVEVATVQAEADIIMSRLAREYVDTNEDTRASVLPGVRFHPLLDGIVNQASIVLLGAVGLVLLIACANVANLLLAKASARGQEIALRLAVGATRVRIVRQLMTEALLLAGVGCLLGIGLAYGLASLASRWKPPVPIPLSFSYQVDAQVALFAAFVSAVAAVAFGLIPALRTATPNLLPSLKGDGSGSSQTGRGNLRWNRVLVVGQLATSLVLLVAGALLTRAVVEARHVDLGFDPAPIASLSFNLEMNNYDLERAVVFRRALMERVGGLAGVDAVALSSRLPLSPDINMDGIWVPGQHGPDDDPAPIDAVRVGPDYFRVTGIPLVYGRGFREDERGDTASVAIINETMARQFWPDRSPVGELVYPGGFDEDPVTIVGIARDHKVRSLGEEPTPYIHFPFSQSRSFRTGVLVRSRLGADAILPRVRAEILAMEPAIVFTEESTAEEVVDVTLAPTRLAAGFMGSFGGLALVLAAVGLYGVIAYTVSRRIREMGLRMALGATGRDILVEVLGQGLKLAAVGIGVGSLAAMALARILGSLLYGVSVVDPMAYLGAASVLLLVAGLANLFPAWRASRVNPMVALRDE